MNSINIWFLVILHTNIRALCFWILFYLGISQIYLVVFILETGVFFRTYLTENL